MHNNPDQIAPHDSTVEEIKALLAEAEKVIASSKDIASEEISSLRDRLRSAVDRGRETATKAAEMARHGYAQADEAIHTHPYAAIGVAAGLGLLLGALLTRGHSSRD